MEIFVNNLSYQIEETELRDTFAPFGDVRRVTVVRDRETGRPRGFGFVDMSSPEAAQQAIAALNGKILQGRPLVVSEARAREPAGARPRPPVSSSAAQPVSGPAPRTWTPQPRPSAPPGLPMISDRRREPGGAEPADPDSPEAELEEQRRRTVARIASFATTRDKKKGGEHFEEGKRRVLKGAEKGRHNKIVVPDDDDELDDPPVRIR